MSRRWVAVGMVLLGVLAGCQTPGGARSAAPPDPRAEAVAWFPPCVDPTPRGWVAPSTAASPMPSVTLECLGRGGPVDLAEPRGVPTVVNVWASWCRPCREELPVFQAYASRMAGRVDVLGVASGDTRTASLALAKDLGVRFPTLFDEKAALIKAVGRTALPVTLFIDPAGRLVYVYNGPPLTADSLAALVERRLGVSG